MTIMNYASYVLKITSKCCTMSKFLKNLNSKCFNFKDTWCPTNFTMASWRPPPQLLMLLMPILNYPYYSFCDPSKFDFSLLEFLTRCYRMLFKYYQYAINVIVLIVRLAKIFSALKI